MITERWRYTGCATRESIFKEATITDSHNSHDKHKLFMKFKSLPNQIGYEALLTDFNGHLWRETLIGQELQDRLKSEASGLEIETADLLKLLHQMCENCLESSCEISSDMKNLILRTCVKIGFIKLKWTFKTESCGGYNEMIKCDFLLPFFANLRDDKVVKEEIDADELDTFYETIIPPLKTQDPPIILTVCNDEIPETCEPVDLSTVETAPLVDLEELKRKTLEEQLQASKKKKKKLI